MLLRPADRQINILLWMNWNISTNSKQSYYFDFSICGNTLTLRHTIDADAPIVSNDILINRVVFQMECHVLPDKTSLFNTKPHN